MTAVYALWAEIARSQCLSVFVNAFNCCMQGDAIYAWKFVTKFVENVLKDTKITKFWPILWVRRLCFSPNSLLWGLLLKKKRGVHRLVRACSVGRGLGVAWAWLGRAWLGRGVGVAWAWRGRGVGVAWARLGCGRGLGVAWAWLGRGVGVAWAWLGRGVGWRGRGLGVAWAWRGRGVG